MNGTKNETPAKERKGTKTLLYLIFILVCAGSIVWTAYMDFSGEQIMPFSDILALVGENWFYLAFALLSLAIVIMSDGVKTSLLLYGSTKRFNLPLGLGTGVLTKFYDFVTPGGAGGQPFAIYHLNKKGVETGAASATVFTSFFIQQICFVVLSVVSLIFSANLEGLNATTRTLAIISAFTCSLVPVLIIVCSLMPKTAAAIVTFSIKLLAKIRIVKNFEKVNEKALSAVKSNAENIKSISKNKTVFILAILCALAAWLAQCSIAYFTLRTFGYDLPVNGFIEWIYIVQMCLILYLSVTLSPTPGASGVSELSFYFVFTTSLAGGVGFTALVTWRLLSFYSYLIAGAIRGIYEKTKKKKLLNE